MKTQKDASYGVVPVCQFDDGWKIFLIEQKGRRGDVFWTLPKGHPEKNELPTETAVRELFEETGLRVKKLYPDQQFSQQYTYVCDEVVVDKNNTYYLGVVEDSKSVLQAQEVKSAGWFDFATAVEKVTYDSMKQLLVRAKEQIQLW